VWKALTDPQVLARTLPGCERLEEKEPNVYAGALDIKVGPVSGKFQGTVSLHDMEENRGYRLELNGQGAPGFVQGKGAVTLEDRDGGGTILTYDLDAQVGGRIAGVGQRLLDSSAKVVTRQALEGLEAQIGALPHGAVAEPGKAETGQPEAPPAPSPARFAARIAKGVFEELIPAGWRPVVIGVAALLLLAIVVLIVRACSG